MKIYPSKVISKNVQTDHSCTNQVETSKKKLLGKTFLYVLLAMVLLIIFLPITLQWILIVETQEEPAEVLLIGELGQSLDTALKLYQQNKIERFLITQATPNQYKTSPITTSIQQAIYKKLLDANIPEEKIDSFQSPTRSRLQFQQQLRSWIQQNEINSYAFFCHVYATRYQTMIHNDTFPEGNVKLVLHTYTGNVIWRKHLLQIQNLFIRMLFWEWVYSDKVLESYENLS